MHLQVRSITTSNLAVYKKEINDIIIKPADQGLSVVVIDKQHYVSKGKRQLNDSNIYEVLDHDPMMGFAKEVSDVIFDRSKGDYISDKCRLFDCKPTESMSTSILSST